MLSRLPKDAIVDHWWQENHNYPAKIAQIPCANFDPRCQAFDDIVAFESVAYAGGMSRGKVASEILQMIHSNRAFLGTSISWNNDQDSIVVGWMTFHEHLAFTSISHIRIHHDYQSLGYGSAMIAILCTIAKLPIRVKVLKSDYGLREFFHCNGFQVELHNKGITTMVLRS